MKQHYLVYLLMLTLLSCKEKPDKFETENLPSPALTLADFTPVSDIDPDVYLATPKNTAADPNNALMDVFRKKKAADMANPEKPRPLPKEEITQIENISHEQPWAPIKDMFKFDWDQIDQATAGRFTEIVQARIIFDNSDLKVKEMAIASGASLPLHAEATPSVYFILGGEGEVMVNDIVANVHVGTSIKFDSYDKKKITATGKDPLKILWFSWAPDGDPTYLKSGYYLTGSNPHIQTLNGILPPSSAFQFWDNDVAKPFEITNSNTSAKGGATLFVQHQNEQWDTLNKEPFYPSSDRFTSASAVEWVDVMNMDPKDFFFAKDLKSLGSTLEMMSRFAKIKSVFRAHRPDSGYDLNYSFLGWGPQSKYITHSHAICEFYYVLEGDVEYIIDQETYHAVPGNFYFHPPYYDHEMRGLKEGLPFLSISGTWVPFGRRELFDLPFLLLEDINVPDAVGFPNDFRFHNFQMKKDMEFGVF